MINSQSNQTKMKNKSGTPLIKCLTECEKNEELTVLSVDTGFGQKRRLANLGLVPGVKIHKRKEAPFRGPLEIVVKGSSLVIGRGLASKIFVTCGESCPYE
jgi:Fe2+ transport system protein FeoA